MSFEIRPVAAGDVPSVVGLVHELADYERAPELCALTEAQLSSALFGGSPSLFGHVAIVGDDVVGCALWFLSFSTWRGVHGIYLEDLFVQPAHRAGHRAGAARRAGCGVRQARLRPPGMGGARLERTGDRFLPLARCRPPGRVDDLPHRGGRAARAF